MRRFLSAGLLCSFAGICLGCGWWFPDSYLGAGHEDKVLTVPEASFAAEISRIFNFDNRADDQITTSGWGATVDADLGDLRQVLLETGRDDSTTIVETYTRMRNEMKLVTEGTEEDISYRRRMSDENSALFSLVPYEELLESLPREFALYVRGAAAYRNHEFEEAERLWNELLKLPADERRFRSTWACYMLGKLLLSGRSAEAIAWFEKTRELGGAGFVDSNKLTTDSLGWQARGEMAVGKDAQAILHYVEFARSGERPHVAIQSLKTASRADATDPELVRNPLARKVITAWIVSNGWRDTAAVTGKTQAEIWSDTLRASNVQLDVSETDQLAWSAYLRGKMDETRYWLERNSDHTPIGKWVQSKLHLRSGRIDQALAIMRGLIRELPADESWFDAGGYEHMNPRSEVAAQTGVLLLGRNEFVSALHTFLQSEYWEDAAYLAERVLTINELREYLERHRDSPDLQTSAALREWFYVDEQTAFNRLSYLLARRCARAGKWDMARQYMPKGVIPIVNEYLKSLEEGRSASRGKRQRAEAMFRAAMIARHRGMEMMGTEIEPDWTLVDGVFRRDEYSGPSVGRAAPLLERVENRYEYRETSAPAELRNPKLLQALTATPRELQRVRASAPRPEERFHYRYVAAELMWECAGLLPNNDPLLAAALYHAGDWHRQKDPGYADRFYKTLVWRCRNLPIGEEADKLRWFPSSAPPTPEVKIPDVESSR